MTPLRELLSRRLRRIVVERRLTYEDVAVRCGLHARTVERFLEGETFSPETCDAICQGLRVDLGSDTGDRLLPGLQLWALTGRPGWWARVSDVAEWLGCGRSSLVERVQVAIKRGGIQAGDRIDGVTDRDSIVGSPDNWLTQSPRGCSLLHTRAVLWLVLTSERARGEAARTSLIDEGLERLRSAGVRR